MNKADVSPPGREAQVKALKGKVDNPYAVSWASFNKSDADGSEGDGGAEGDDYDDASAFEAALTAPTAGHTGMAGTYGQPRGAEAPTTTALEKARDNVPYDNTDAAGLFGKEAMDMLDEGKCDTDVGGHNLEGEQAEEEGVTGTMNPLAQPPASTPVTAKAHGVSSGPVADVPRPGSV